MELLGLPVARPEVADRLVDRAGHIDRARLDDVRLLDLTGDVLRHETLELALDVGRVLGDRGAQSLRLEPAADVARLGRRHVDQDRQVLGGPGGERQRDAQDGGEPMGVDAQVDRELKRRGQQHREGHGVVRDALADCRADLAECGHLDHPARADAHRADVDLLPGEHVDAREHPLGGDGGLEEALAPLGVRDVVAHVSPRGRRAGRARWRSAPRRSRTRGGCR